MLVMEKKKMSLSAINGVLSKSEMKKIMAGSGSTGIKCGELGCDILKPCASPCTCQHEYGAYYRCR